MSRLIASKTNAESVSRMLKKVVLPALWMMVIPAPNRIGASSRYERHGMDFFSTMVRMNTPNRIMRVRSKNCIPNWRCQVSWSKAAIMISAVKTGKNGWLTLL